MIAAYLLVVLGSIVAAVGTVVSVQWLADKVFAFGQWRRARVRRRTSKLPIPRDRLVRL